MHGSKNKKISILGMWAAVLLTITFIIPSSAILVDATEINVLSTSWFSTLDLDGDGLTEQEEKEYGTDPLIPDMYVRYNDSFYTKDYYCWKNGSISFKDIVIRRGTQFTVYGAPFSEISIDATNSNMEDLYVRRSGPNSWSVWVGNQAPIGGYTISLSSHFGGWYRNMTLYVIFDPRDSTLNESEIRAYAYDEQGSRDENGIYYSLSYLVDERSTGQTIPPIIEYKLYPFSEHIFKLSMAIADGLSSDKEISNRSMWAVSNIMEYRGTYENNVSSLLAPVNISQMREAASEYNHGDLDIIAGYCYDYANILTSLSRAIGIPARPVSGILQSMNSGDYHVWTEIWLEDNSQRGWFVFDANDGAVWNSSTHTHSYTGNPVGAYSRTEYYALAKASDIFITGVYTGDINWTLDDGAIRIDHCYHPRIKSNSKNRILNLTSLYVLPDTDNDGLTDMEEEKYGRNEYVPDMYVRYNPEYFTDDYDCWTDGLISFSSIIIRSGTTFIVHGPDGANLMIYRTNKSLSDLSAAYLCDGMWAISVPSYANAGEYEITMNFNSTWQRTMYLYII